MTDNPYASPSDTLDGHQPDSRIRSALRGVFPGSYIGASIGAAIAGLTGLLFIILAQLSTGMPGSLMVRVQDAITRIIALVMLGVFIGILVGAVVGALVGAAGFRKSRPAARRNEPPA